MHVFSLHANCLAGSCAVDTSLSAQKWANTAVGRLAPNTPLYTPEEKTNCTFQRAKAFLSTNGDKCSPLDFVACSNPSTNAFGVDGISVVRVKEALGCKRGIFPVKNVDCILVEAIRVGTLASSQGMPRLTASKQFFTVSPSVSFAIHFVSPT